MSFMDKIRDRPVRFNALLHAVFGLVVMAGFLTEALVGAIILIINAFLAFWLDSYTVAVNRESGQPRNPQYVKKQ